VEGEVREAVIRRSVHWLDERSGAAPFLRGTLRYLFPDHWSFLLGEVALYCFVVLVATGIYLTLFFEPSLAKTTYDGVYEPLRGVEMSHAYRSTVELSFDVKAGLLIRQTHHWAADVFVAAIVIHLARVFFTGAFRKPRELTYVVGVLMLFTVLLEGYLGYSLVDDLLSGMGLAIGNAVAVSTPVIGGNLALAIWGGQYPGSPEFESRMYVAHILIFPVVIGALLTLHLVLIAARHHTQFRSDPRATNRRMVGVPLWPGYAPRSLGLLTGTAGLLFLMGGLIQINPIWLWGPYHLADATNGAQPDWYLGWLIGALRLVPSFDLTIGNYTLVPNPFWGGALFPLIVLVVLISWPWLERRVTGDYREHNVLDRPRDAPGRTAFGAAFGTWVFLVFFVGAADRIYLFLDWSYAAQIWIYRFAIWIVPIVIFFVTRRVCRELQEEERVEDEREAAEAAASAAPSVAPAAGRVPAR
jgi:ubiquinol-cytochrome c reductase cytochrome b subunit